jgi:hypothetical protein
MGRLSIYGARWIWGALLWIIRRPTIKRMRRNIPSRLPSGMRARAAQSIKTQDAFARRYGLRILTFMLNALTLVVLFSITTSAVLYAIDMGWLTVQSE